MSKYSNYMAKFKLNVLSYVDANRMKVAGRHFSVDPNSIRYWRRQKDKLKAAKTSSKSFHGPKTGKYPKINNGVIGCVNELWNDCCAVSYEMIQNKACEIAAMLNIDRKDFKASIGWVICFMGRQNLSLRRRTEARYK